MNGTIQYNCPKNVINIWIWNRLKLPLMPTQQQEIEFGDLLNRNCQTINSICLRYCGGNAFYFDELRQECAVAIWAEFSRYGLDRFRGDSAESTWIYQISYHAVITLGPASQTFETKPSFFKNGFLFATGFILCADILWLRFIFWQWSLFHISAEAVGHLRSITSRDSLRSAISIFNTYNG